MYESAYRSLEDTRLDIRFIPSEGTGGFADPLKLYRSLDIPTAVVTDFDFLAKDGELRNVLKALLVSDDEVKRLASRIAQALREVQSKRNPIDQEFVAEDLKALFNSSMNLDSHGVTRLRGGLLNLANKLNNLGDMKDKGLQGVPDRISDSGGDINLRDEFKNILSELQEIGLFVVPVGELESWLPRLMRGTSRTYKSQWATLAAEKIEDVGERDEDVWQFMRSVHDHLEKKLDESMSPI